MIATPKIFEFGDCILDCDRFELRRAGHRVKVERKPMELLILLVTKQGTLVTRDEIAASLWDPDVFVDVDPSINTLIRKIRYALRDNAIEPRYVETVSRKGYRFVSEVVEKTPARAFGVNRNGPASEGIEADSRFSPEPPPLRGHDSVVEVEQAHAPSNVLPAPAKANTSSNRELTYALALALAALVIAVTIVVLRPSGHRDNKPPRLLVRDAFFPSISRDGKLLAYLSTLGGDLPHVWVQQAAAEQSMQVTFGQVRDYAVELAPNATYILVGRDEKGGRLSVRSIFPSEPKFVLPSAKWGRISPDGQTILCFGDGEVFVASAKTGDAVQLPFVNRDYQLQSLPLWAATGNAFVFLGRRKGEPLSANRWYTADLVARKVRELTIPNLGQLKNCLSWLLGWMRHGRKSLIIWAVQDQDVWRLYAVPVDDRGEPFGKQLLGSGNNIIYDPSGSFHIATAPATMSDDGRLLFTVTAVTEQIFQLPTDTSERQRGPLAELPVRENALYYSPSVSADGHTLAYIAGETGRNSRLTVRNLLTGKSRILHEITGIPRDASASLSRDGSQVVFNPWCLVDLRPPDCPSFLIPSEGGRPERLCKNCQARGFNARGSLVLMQKYRGDTPGMKQDRIVAVDLPSRKEQELLYDDEHSVYHPFFSADDHWVVFKRQLTWTKSQLMIAPYRGTRAVPVSEWIEITDGKNSDDKPQFSPDGKNVYFTSDRDRYVCIWSQRLDPVTKRPLGDPVAYEHFHNAMGRDAASYPEIQAMSDLTVGADRILINLQQRRHDIWAVQVK